jgi:hypothetical protein
MCEAVVEDEGELVGVVLGGCFASKSIVMISEENQGTMSTSISVDVESVLRLSRYGLESTDVRKEHSNWVGRVRVLVDQ